MTILALLICSSLIGAAEPGPEFTIPHVGADLIPQAPQFPDNLPAPEERADGTWLPKPTDDAIKATLRYCLDDYPAVCGTAIGEARRVERVICSGQAAVQDAQCKALVIKEKCANAGTWKTWEVALVGSGIGVGAAIIVGGIVWGVMKANEKTK